MRSQSILKTQSPEAAGVALSTFGLLLHSLEKETKQRANQTSVQSYLLNGKGFFEYYEAGRVLRTSPAQAENGGLEISMHLSCAHNWQKDANSLKLQMLVRFKCF